MQCPTSNILTYTVLCDAACALFFLLLPISTFLCPPSPSSAAPSLHFTSNTQVFQQRRWRQRVWARTLRTACHATPQKQIHDAGGCCEQGRRRCYSQSPGNEKDRNSCGFRISNLKRRLCMFANRNIFHRFAFIALSISKYLQLNLNETHLLFGGSQL